jgi:probable HAF family extracellular repeat protein
MKSIMTLIAASSFLGALAIAQPPHYTVRDLGTLGGTSSEPFAIKNNGLITGTAALIDGTEHAVFWYEGLKGDFGPPAFGGPNSIAFGVNEGSQAVGEAETSTLDPNGEDFCGFKSLGLRSIGTTCLPFLWQNGVMIPLPTLGGNNGGANMINNRGEVAGFAENTTRDPACPAPQVLQFKPVVWVNGEVQELPAFPGDPDGVALAINESGQVAGASGGCTTFSQNTLTNLVPLHALLWQNGTVTDLGNLGGTGQGGGIMAFNLNNQGQVVGVSDLLGDTNFHAFLWTKEKGMQDLGTLPGDVASVALGINDSGEVVGVSLDVSFNLRAFVWQKGVMTDLITLIPADDSSLLPFLAESINARGQIVGQAFQKSTGDVHAFLATPINARFGRDSASPAARGVTSPMVLSEDARRLLQQRVRFGRFGTRPIGPR